MKQGMKPIVVGGLLVLVLSTAGCNTDDDAAPTLDTAGSGAPLYPGGVEPEETMEEIEP